MNTATATVSRPLRTTAPASAATSRPSLLKRLAAGTWTVLLAIGHARGRAHLRQLAAQFDGTRPEFAAQLRRAAQRGWIV